MAAITRKPGEAEKKKKKKRKNEKDEKEEPALNVQYGGPFGADADLVNYWTWKTWQSETTKASWEKVSNRICRIFKSM